MERLRREGFAAVGYDRLKVPCDPELGDGRAYIDFVERGERKTYYAILTFRPDGVNQACIFSPRTAYTEAWNRLNCHY